MRNISAAKCTSHMKIFMKNIYEDNSKELFSDWLTNCRLN